MAIHRCTKCDTGAEVDCMNCKLAELARRQEEKKNDKFRIDDDDDPSISERMTEDGNRLVIPLLFVCALLIFILVILFTKVMS